MVADLLHLAQEEELDMKELVMLCIVYSLQPVTPNDLQKAYGMSQPATMNTRLSLEDKGLVKRKAASDKDRRLKCVALTAKGRNLLIRLQKSLP